MDFTLHTAESRSSIKQSVYRTRKGLRSSRPISYASLTKGWLLSADFDRSTQHVDVLTFDADLEENLTANQILGHLLGNSQLQNGFGRDSFVDVCRERVITPDFRNYICPSKKVPSRKTKRRSSFFFMLRQFCLTG